MLIYAVRRRVRGEHLSVLARLILLGAATALVAGVMQLLLARSLGAQAPDRNYALVTTVGPDTISVERVSVRNNRWTGDVSSRTSGRTIWSATRTSAGRFGSLELIVYRTLGDTAPVQRLVLSSAGDSVRADAMLPTPRVHMLAAKPDAFVLLSSSFAMVAAIAERAPRAGSASVPVLLPTGTGMLLDASVRWSADTATITLAGQVMRCVLDQNGDIRWSDVASQGLRTVRVDGAEAARISYGAPSYDPPPGAPYTATDVRIPVAAGHLLAGTFTRPRDLTGKLPVVVTISGSGAQDRDETIPVADGYRPFRQLADTLGRSGIAVLRFDDRGTGASTGVHSTATSADFADDVRAAVAWLRTRDDVDPDRIVLLGHSEGGLIAPLVASTDARLAGVVLLAGPAQTGRDIVHFQQRYAIDRDTAFKTDSARDAAAAAARRQFAAWSETRPWYKFFASYDPLKTARALRVPALILQGATDQQITAVQAEELGKAMRDGGNGDVTVRVYPGLNHLFLQDSDGNPANYARIASGRIGADVTGLIVSWVAARKGPRQ